MLPCCRLALHVRLQCIEPLTGALGAGVSCMNRALYKRLFVWPEQSIFAAVPPMFPTATVTVSGGQQGRLSVECTVLHQLTATPSGSGCTKNFKLALVYADSCFLRVVQMRNMQVLQGRLCIPPVTSIQQPCQSQHRRHGMLHDSSNASNPSHARCIPHTARSSR